MVAKVRLLEFHVTHACNLACTQCSHFSNFKHNGLITPENTENQYKLWHNRISVFQLSLLGGEPTLNPALLDIILLSRQYWPNTELQLVTNGFRLPKHPSLPKVLEETNCRLEISVHHASPEYQAALEPAKKIVEQWQNNYKLRVKWRSSFSTWRKVYKLNENKMEPYTDNNPQQSWNVCIARDCMQLYEGKLWKCPPITYLKMQLAKLDQLNDEKWQPYLKYQPLSPDCTDEQLLEFTSRKSEAVCSMCPANVDFFKLDNPIRGKL